MTGNLTLKSLGFDLNLVERNLRGDCLGSSIESVALMLMLGETPFSKPRRLVYDQRQALNRAACIALGRYVNLVVCAGSKADRSRCADIIGFSENEIWPYASATPIEKRRIESELATTTAEPLDPISPLPDLPPPADLKWPVREGGPFEQPTYRTLPPPTAPWMGDLHRAFSASPADTANAALRARVAELEAQLASSARTDGYYNGGERLPHADQMAANEAAYLSQRGAHRDRVDFNLEMAAWPPVYEDRAPGPLRRFANCLSESVKRLIAKGAWA